MRKPKPVNPIALRNLFAILAFVIVLLWALGTAEEGQSRAITRPVTLVICDVFGERACADALEVAWCESRFKVDARNGQYRGLFQMGSWERRTFGHGRTARAQAEAARRYWVKTGRDWSPWECQP